MFVSFINKANLVVFKQNVFLCLYLAGKEAEQRTARLPPRLAPPSREAHVGVVSKSVPVVTRRRVAIGISNFFQCSRSYPPFIS